MTPLAEREQATLHFAALEQHHLIKGIILLLAAAAAADSHHLHCDSNPTARHRAEKITCFLCATPRTMLPWPGGREISSKDKDDSEKKR